MKHRAFTLLEVLIVITIIGILTSLLVLNFQGVREKQELSILADKSLALMQQAKAEVSSGKVSVDEDGLSTYLCEGAFFEQGAQPQFVTAPYVDSECDYSALTFEEYGVQSGIASVGGIELEGLALDSILALFTPPSSDLQLSNESGTELYEGEAELRFATPNFLPDEDEVAFVLKLSQSTGFAQLVLDNPSADAEE